jgi:hypothetical protein
MIVFRSDIPPFQTANPEQKHHDERLLEYGMNLHLHFESIIAQSETPDETAAQLAADLEARKIEGQRIKEEWMRRFYGAENVSAKRFLDFISATTLPTR